MRLKSLNEKLTSNTTKTPIFLLNINTTVLLEKYTNRVLEIKTKIYTRIEKVIVTFTVIDDDGGSGG